MSEIKGKQHWEDARDQSSSVDSKTKRKWYSNFKKFCMTVLVATHLFLRAISEG